MAQVARGENLGERARHRGVREVDMDVHFALEDYEVARGFILCCQSYQ